MAATFWLQLMLLGPPSHADAHSRLFDESVNRHREFQNGEVSSRLSVASLLRSCCQLLIGAREHYWPKTGAMPSASVGEAVGDAVET